MAVADELALSAQQRRNLEFAALLHDVGKITIPKEIINKPGPLNTEEWAYIKRHSHHERWDGGGYPDGLTADSIPLEARIIACCDTWNAMRTDRAYRKALPHEAAFAELWSSAGSQLDPRIVEILATIVAPAPAVADTPAPAAEPAPEEPESAGADPLDELVTRAGGRASAQTPERAPMADGALEDVRAVDPVERLLEDSWDSRSQRADRCEVVVEMATAVLFLAIAVPLAIPALLGGKLPIGFTLLLVALYAVVSRTVKFPIGAGYVVPSYLVLVPMLLLLPPSAVPLLTAAGLRRVARAGPSGRVDARRSSSWRRQGSRLPWRARRRLRRRSRRLDGARVVRAGGRAKA
jgi:HD domain